MGLGDSWHKVAVYFGIADDDDEYDEDETLAPHEELERSYQERAERAQHQAARSGRNDYDDIFADEPRRRARHPAPVVVRAVEPARPSRVEVHLVIPKNFNDAQQIADKFKIDVPVIINLQGCRHRAGQAPDRLLQRAHLRARRRHAACRRQDLPAHAAKRRSLSRGTRAAHREGLLQSVLGRRAAGGPPSVSRRRAAPEVATVNVAIIGAGHIAAALVQGWRRPSSTEPPSLIVFDVVGERAERLAAAGGGRTAVSAAEAVTAADLTVLAVRPEDVQGVLADLAPALGGRPIVSVAAGVSVERLVAALPAGAGVCRVMPNVAAAVGLGVFLFVRGTLSGAQTEVVVRLFSAAGTVFALEEERFRRRHSCGRLHARHARLAVTYFAAAAETHGIESGAARLLAVESVHGAAAMIAAGGDPAAVTAAAATPGGMTAAAVASFEADGVADAVQRAVTAAADRAKELA